MYKRQQAAGSTTRGSRAGVQAAGAQKAAGRQAGQKAAGKRNGKRQAAWQHRQGSRQAGKAAVVLVAMSVGRVVWHREKEGGVYKDDHVTCTSVRCTQEGKRCTARNACTLPACTTIDAGKMSSVHDAVRRC